MPFFVAKIFIGNNYMKLNNELGIAGIRKHSFQESGSKDFKKMGKNVFLRMKEELNIAKIKYMKNHIPESDVKEFQTNMYDFYRVRLNKLLRFASSSQPLHKKRQILSEEEQELYEILCQSISDFLEFIRNGDQGTDCKK